LNTNPFAKAAATQDAKLSPDAAEKLRALGYMAYHSPVSAEALAAGLPDPKDRLWEFNAILKATDAFRSETMTRQKPYSRQSARKIPTCI
jgi:hypothetical protein